MNFSEVGNELKKMKGKTFTYDGKRHVLKDYFIDEKSKKFEVITDRTSFKRTFDLASKFFESLEPFKPAAEAPPPAPAEKAKAAPAKTAAPGKEPGIFHTPSAIIVYCTYDYKLFRKIRGNRPLNENKIKKIMAEIKAGNNMLPYDPIQVTERDNSLLVLDGQHRLAIDERLKEPVYYILVKEEKSMPDIAKVNSNVEKWKNKDFLNCYIQAGNRNYDTIKSFLEKYEISLGVSLNLLKVGHPGTEGTNVDIKEQFNNGVFEVKHLEAATKIADQVMLFKDFSQCRSRAFVIAVYRIIKENKIPINDVAVAYKKNPGMLSEQANYKGYITLLEQIVNVGKQKRIIIF